MAARVRVDQLCGNANAVPGLAHPTFEHVTDAKRPRHVRDRHRPALEDERGVASDHMQVRELGQVGDDVLADTVREIVLLGITGHVGERQNGDR